jgi:hypothetical protein
MNIEELTSGGGHRLHFDPDILANLRDFSEGVERIRNMKASIGDIEADVSAEAKKRYLYELYAKREKRYRELVEEKRSKADDRFYSAQYNTFKPTGGEAAMTSFRDALYRLDGITEQRKLRDMLERSYEVGDDVMAKALLRRGHELQSEGLIDRYYQMYPGERKNWEEFKAASEERSGIWSNMPAGRPDKPPELQGYTPAEGEGAA